MYKMKTIFETYVNELLLLLLLLLLLFNLMWKPCIIVTNFF